MLDIKFSEEKKDEIKAAISFGGVLFLTGCAIARNWDPEYTKTTRALYSAALGVVGSIAGYTIAKDKYDSMRWSLTKGYCMGKSIMLKASEDYNGYIYANVIKAYQKAADDGKLGHYLGEAIEYENNRGKEA